ncbi:hypothetical protein F66182_3121 [Fusarium sp. NRRL 66182]|nr:hypothetical protein F66182_3121 [Fusarium sp. NRRL 66182]
MAAKDSSSATTYQPLPRDDPSAALLEPSEGGEGEDGQKAVVKLTFSPVVLVRTIVIPLAIADLVFICQANYNRGAVAVFAIGTILMFLWHGYRIFKSFLPGKKANKFELKIGSFFCTFGTTSQNSHATNGALSCLTSLVDFSFGLLLIGPSVLAFRTDMWRNNYVDEEVGGLSITLIILQSAIALLNLFSLFRKMRIAAYKAENEEEEEGAYTITDVYRDEVSEPRESMSSDI